MDTKDLNQNAISEWEVKQAKPTQLRLLQAMWDVVALYLLSLTLVPHLCVLSPCRSFYLFLLWEQGHWGCLVSVLPQPSMEAGADVVSAEKQRIL